MPFSFDDFHFCRSRVIGLDMTENRIFTLCRMITWVVFLRMFWNPIFRHIKSNNSGTAKVKIVKNKRDPPLFTGKLLIKFQNILRNTTQVIIRHRVKILFSVIKSNNSGTAKVKIVKKRRGSSSLHQYAADKILKDSKKHNSSYRTT
jgi:hypothetical protein